MASNIFYVLLFTAVISQGSCLEEIWLDDIEVNHVSHPYVGGSISIAKGFLDTLRSCHVMFPDGIMYEAYPNYDIPDPKVFFLKAVEPFLSCGIGFRGVGTDFSGVYQLMSTVVHNGNNNDVSMTRRRFNIKVTESDWRSNE